MKKIYIYIYQMISSFLTMCNYAIVYKDDLREKKFTIEKYFIVHKKNYCLYFFRFQNYHTINCM